MGVINMNKALNGINEISQSGAANKLEKMLVAAGFKRDQYSNVVEKGNYAVDFSDPFNIYLKKLESDGNTFKVIGTIRRIARMSDEQMSLLVKKLSAEAPSINQESILKENTMKKSELKSLIKTIVQETKGLSGFKKTKDSTEHTEKIATSKDLTGAAPKEKEEGKKLPVVKKPATPQKVGDLKEEIIAMIRESIEEMARVKGAVGSKFKVQDPSSPTGWVVKGHKTIPDGTPTEAPKGPYVPKGTNPNMGRPKKVDTAPAGGQGSDAGTRDEIENILTAAPETSDEEIINQLSANEEGGFNTDPAFIKKTADELRKELGADKSSGAEDAPEADLAAMASAEERKKAAQRAAWIKKLQAKRQQPKL